MKSRQPEAVKKPKRPKKLEPVNLSDFDIWFIAEATYQRKLKQWSQEMLAIKAGVRRTTI